MKLEKFIERGGKKSIHLISARVETDLLNQIDKACEALQIDKSKFLKAAIRMALDDVGKSKVKLLE